jgi:hypothetical protein
VTTGKIVKLVADVGGGHAGDYYAYTGTATLVGQNLAAISYATNPDWAIATNGQKIVEDDYETLGGVYGDRNQYDSGFVFTYTQAQKDAYVAAHTFSLAALENPVSPGLMAFLYPHVEFGGGLPNSDSTELANVIGDEVDIVAGTKTNASGNVIPGQEGSIGRRGDVITIDNPADFEHVTDEGKLALANAVPDDVIGVNYRVYQYSGSARNGVDLSHENFGAGGWTQVVTNFVTGTSSTATVNRTVLAGQTVLVQLDATRYGLYRATTTFTGNIANKDIYQGAGWQRLTTQGGTKANKLNHETDGGPANLVAGDIVLDKHFVQSLTLQLFDDIDLEAQDDRDVSLGAHAGGQVIVQTSDNLQIHHVLAGGDVRLQASRSSSSDPDDAIPGGNITGDGTLFGDTANPASDTAIGTRGNLILLADGSVGTAANPLRLQVAPTGLLSLNVTGEIHLNQLADTTLNLDYTDTTPDTTAFNPVTRGFTVTPAEVTQFGYVFSPTSLQLPTLQEWIMEVPQNAAKRAILIGAALGVMATGLRVILGIERSYLSGED